MAPTRPPTATELINNSVVQAAMDQAWADSQPNDPANRHEEGGWIYMDTATGQISTARAAAGSKRQISLAGPPTVAGSILVGTFHTHPNPTAEDWNPRPSATDKRSAAYSGVPWLIRSDIGVFHTGPKTRRGGIVGGPGFPL
jgi:Prokaryotic homologs of the JAB domain